MMPVAARIGHGRDVQPAPARVDTTSHRTILVVDDQGMVLRSTKRLLAREGFRVLEATSGAAALEVLATHGDTVDLLVTDVAMPEMGGVALASRVRELRPQVPIVYMSGYFDDPAVVADVQAKRARLISKPFTREDLLSAVVDALGKDGRPDV